MKPYSVEWRAPWRPGSEPNTGINCTSEGAWCVIASDGSVARVFLHGWPWQKERSARRAARKFARVLSKSEAAR